MKLNVLGSGSKGNCYLLQDDKDCLILEAGVPFKEVLRALIGNLRKVCACLVTHEHQDHAKYVKDYCEHGIKVYMTAGTKIQILSRYKEAMPKYLLQHCIQSIKQDQEGNYDCIFIRQFSIQPFGTVHDSAEPCGYFIHHPETGNVAFATDTAFVPNTFKDLTNLIIECNYDPELLEARTDIPKVLKERIKDNHQSIGRCIGSIKANTKGTLHQAIICHISEADGDADTFGQRVETETGIHTETAIAGAEFEIKQYPF